VQDQRDSADTFFHLPQPIEVQLRFALELERAVRASCRMRVVCPGTSDSTWSVRSRAGLRVTVYIKIFL
jgi:hypothetical protein